jgi:hypothetical protein
MGTRREGWQVNPGWGPQLEQEHAIGDFRLLPDRKRHLTHHLTRNLSRLEIEHIFTSLGDRQPIT